MIVVLIAILTGLVLCALLAMLGYVAAEMMQEKEK